MTTRLLVLGLMTALATTAQAQTPKPARWTLGVGAGGAAAADNFGPGADWKSGWSADANLTYRLTSNLGLRGDATFAQNALNAAAIPGEGRLNKFDYMGNLVWQAVGVATERWRPYALAGLGAVRIHAIGSDSSFTRLGGDVGVGFNYRLGRLGLRAEGRDVMYKFDRFGYSKNQNDVVWEGGVTVRL